jgi:hypothetical protein
MCVYLKFSIQSGVRNRIQCDFKVKVMMLLQHTCRMFLSVLFFYFLTIVLYHQQYRIAKSFVTTTCLC